MAKKKKMEDGLLGNAMRAQAIHKANMASAAKLAVRPPSKKKKKKTRSK